MKEGSRFLSKVISPSPSPSWSSSCYSWDRKSDIIAFAFGNPANKCNAKLSQDNEDLLGYDAAGLLTRRHNLELQRCSQFYSLASIFDEKSTKDKHSFHRKNMKKISSTGRKYIRRLFICF